MQKNLLEGSQVGDDEEDMVEDAGIKDDPQVGDVVVFDVAPSQDNPLQFGLGVIKEISIGRKGKIHFQWMAISKCKKISRSSLAGKILKVKSITRRPRSTRTIERLQAGTQARKLPLTMPL